MAAVGRREAGAKRPLRAPSTAVLLTLERGGGCRHADGASRVSRPRRVLAHSRASLGAATRHGASRRLRVPALCTRRDRHPMPLSWLARSRAARGCRRRCLAVRRHSWCSPWRRKAVSSAAPPPESGGASTSARRQARTRRCEATGGARCSDELAGTPRDRVRCLCLDWHARAAQRSEGAGLVLLRRERGVHRPKVRRGGRRDNHRAEEG